MNTKIQDKLSKQFIKKGYLVLKIENKKSYKKISKHISKIIRKFLKIKNNYKDDFIFNNIHNLLGNKNLNELRLKIYNELNSKKWFNKTYFSLASNAIKLLVGTELAMQNNINFSIQTPKDKSSTLNIHADSLSGESKFQVVLWVPLVNAYKTKSMYIYPREFSLKQIKQLNKYKYRGIETIHKNNLKRRKFIKVKKGEFLIFSPNLLHGNELNITNETRISMNARFKNFFSTYSEKNIYGKRIGYFYVPLEIKPTTTLAMKFLIPNEF